MTVFADAVDRTGVHSDQQEGEQTCFHMEIAEAALVSLRAGRKYWFAGHLDLAVVALRAYRVCKARTFAVDQIADADRTVGGLDRVWPQR